VNASECNDRQTGCGVERSDVEVSGSGYNRKWYVRVKETYEVIVEEYIEFFVKMYGGRNIYSEGIYTVFCKNVWWKEYIQ
jgi:hypothetical protein